MHIWPESIPILIGEMGWFLLECLVFQSLYGLFLAPHHTVSRMFSMFSVLQHRSQRLGQFGTNLYTNQTTILELSWNWHVYGLMMFTNFSIGIARNNLPFTIHTGQKNNQWGLTLTINDGDEKSATTETVLLANPIWQWNILHLWFMLVYLPLKSVISDSHLWLLEGMHMYTSENWHRT